MIQGLKFKDSEGYIRATIDNQILDIPLKEIRKLPTIIINRQSNNLVPIYTQVPIDISVYSTPYPEDLNTNDNDSTDVIDIDENHKLIHRTINLNLESKIDIVPMYKAEQHKVNNTWEYQNIFSSYDDYIQDRQLSLIDKGVVTIQILNTNNDILYEYNMPFSNGRLQTLLTDELPYGEYTMQVLYNGNKYYQPSTLSYKFYVQKRELKYRFDKDAYSANPLEEINLKAQLYDAISGKIISDCYIHYIFNDEEFLVKSNENGYVDINIQMPSQSNTCNQDVVIYNLTIYVDSDTYWSEKVVQNILMNKLKTVINGQAIPSTENETDFYVKGDVIAYNYDMIENVKHGDIVLSFEDGQQYIDNVSTDGLFSFLLSSNNFYNLATNGIDTESFDVIKPIKTKVNIESNSPFDVGKEFSIKVHVDNMSTTDTINEGIVVFYLKTTATPSEVITKYTAEVDNNGDSFGYFYPSVKGDYKIYAEYKGFFEYQNSNASTNIKIK